MVDLAQRLDLLRVDRLIARTEAELGAARGRGMRRDGRDTSKVDEAISHLIAAVEELRAHRTALRRAIEDR